MRKEKKYIIFIILIVNLFLLRTHTIFCSFFLLSANLKKTSYKFLPLFFNIFVSLKNTIIIIFNILYARTYFVFVIAGVDGETPKVFRIQIDGYR